METTVMAMDKRWSDERGAILVLGIMLGAFLVGALFYLVGVGHAVIWREAVQDAADAVAYEATAWNARGMNVVVAINIFMAIVMGILIAWRLALLFMTILVAVAAIACAISFIVPVLEPACGAAVWSGRILGRMMPRDFKIQKRIYKILSVLHKGQALVASAGPILSVARSSIVNSQRENVDVAVALSSQMLPAPFLEKIAAVAGAPIDPLGGMAQPLVGDGGDRAAYRKGGRPGGGNGGGGNGGGGNGGKGGGNNGKGGKQPQCQNNNNNGNKGPKPGQRTPRKGRSLMGKPYSLGAEESDDISTFCGKAGKRTADVFKLLAMEAVGIDGASDAGSSSKFSGVFEFLTKGMAGYFCGNFDPGAITDLVTTQINDNCAKSEVSSKYDGKKKKGETAEDACKRELKAQSDADVAANGAGNSGGKSGYRKGGAADSVMWADVWGPLANGNMFAQTWGLVRATRDHSQLDKLINVAGSFGGGTTTINDDDATIFAQSEVYFDCAQDWDACLPTAAWTMNWRARLRRVHSPLDIAATTVEKTVSDTFRQVLDQDPVRKVIGGAPFAQYFEDPAGHLLPASIMDPLEEMRNEVAEQGGDAAKWVTEQGRDRASIIH